MTASTHLAFSALGYFVVTTVGNAPPRMEFLAGAGFASLLPDIDNPTSAIGRALFPLSQPLNRWLGHRTFTHSLLGILAFGALLFAVHHFGHRPMWWALVAGYASHVLLDQANVMGVELLWPWRGRAVLFLNERYRITVGGRGEYVLLCSLVVLAVLLYPVAEVGLKRSLHYVMGDVRSAVADFRELEDGWDVEAVVRAADPISGQKFSGVFPVIGAPSDAGLLVEDHGRPKLLGVGAEAHLRSSRVWVRPTRPHTVTVQRVAMGGRLLGDLRGLLEGRRAYVFGELAVAPHARQAEQEVEAGRYATVRWHGRRVSLSYATAADLAGAWVASVPVEAGDALVKYLDTAGPRVVEPLRALGEVVALSFTVDSPEAIRVKSGDRVHKGDLLAYRADQGEVASLVSDMMSQLERAIAEDGERRAERQRVALEVQQARHDLARARADLERYGANGEFFPKQARAAKEKIAADEKRVEELTLKLERLGKDEDKSVRQAEDAARQLQVRLGKKWRELEVRSHVAGEVLGVQQVMEDRNVRVHLTLRTFNEKPTTDQPVGGTQAGLPVRRTQAGNGQ